MEPPNENEAHKTKRLKIERENGCGNVTSYFDFEKHRASFVLEKGEIWAVRDQYGMPRRYALVEKDGDIHSAQVRLLRNCSSRYHAWGKFEYENNEPLDIPVFSHKILKWERCGGYAIFPRKGEVWAIRTDNEKTIFGHSTPTLLKYQIAEVLEDYVECKGMKIMYLVSIRGGNGSRFRRYQPEFHVRPKYVREQFSHHVPSIRVSGDKSRDDLLELDLSSLPLYVDDFESNVEPEINDNYLFLGYLDQSASYHPGNGSILPVYDHECRVPQKYVEVRLRGAYHNAMHELVPILTYGNEKKWHEAGLPVACGKFIVAPVENEKHFILSRRFIWDMNKKNIEGVSHVDIYPKKGDVWGIYKDQNLVQACSPRGALDYQIVAIIERTEKYVKVAHLSRVEGFKGLFKKRSDPASEVEFLVPINEFYRFSHNIPSYIFDEKCSNKLLRGAFVLDPFLVPQKHGDSYSFNDPFLLERSIVRPSWSAIQYFVNKQRNSTNLASPENHRKESEQEEIVVEDLQDGEPNIDEITPTNVHASDMMEFETDKHDIIHHIKFHDFDDTKSENNFKLGEVWALFNELNGVPLSYARIDKFLNSGRMLEVTLLQPHPVAEEEMKWVEANLPMACGTFRAFQSTCIEKAILSHRVIGVDEQPSKLFFRVYPRKGEVWAIYKHWDVNWTYSDMSSNVQYKLAEIVSDFTPEAGVTVAALDREEGHENVFRRKLHEGFWLFMAFKGKELLRFSHCIPSLKMIGDQDGCTSEGSFRVKFSHNGI